MQTIDAMGLLIGENCDETYNAEMLTGISYKKSCQAAESELTYQRVYATAKIQ